ncbi:hypothetical protein BU17DRAFT_73877 [Hysterangium stoloniferum]|nr:hypothetical protein BU17DRAFT_73877 [Hysterangium stoloniferum]
MFPPTPPASSTPTQTVSSRSHSPDIANNLQETIIEESTGTSQKKKKKKKPKKPKAQEVKFEPKKNEPERPPVLCISRNKHWRYISSYHGPWLQLPVELLESLLVLNMDPNTFAIPDHRVPSLPPPPSVSHLSSVSFGKQRSVQYLDISPPPSPPLSDQFALTSSRFLPPDNDEKPTPPPIDPGIFRSVTMIRRLIDEASDLAVRAASGLSAATLGGMRSSPSSVYGGHWATAQSLGINPLGEQVGNGRNTAMSAMRVHRLRVLAVQRLATAYKADEIAASVMVMQGASALDDIAERVLKIDPNDPDARYVHFFHEKIPSRQLAESTTTAVLDELVEAHPQRLEFLRTRGIVRCFRDEYLLAARDFTHVLKEARNIRKSRHAHTLAIDSDHGSNVRGRRSKKAKVHGQAPPDGTSVSQASEPDSLPLHPSVLPDAPEPIEHQAMFLRGAAYLQYVVYLIEAAVLKIEGINKNPSADHSELRLCYIENGKYGGVEIGNPDGPLGSPSGQKVKAYRQVLNQPAFREQITGLLKKSIRDHERFLAYFDTLEPSTHVLGGDLAQRTRTAFLLTESLRPGSHSQPPPLNAPPVFTTYHPLLVESHFSILLANLLLGDFVSLLPIFARTATLVDGLEGYPVFLPARSMAQAEFIEILERLASGWVIGIQPHSYASGHLTIAAPPVAEPYEVDLSAASSSTSIPRPRNETNYSSTSGQGILPSSSGHDSLVEHLDCARILLAPVAQRQRERADKAAADKASGNDKKKSLNINIPLHGPRVEVVLAYLGAVHLPDLGSVA